MRCCDAVEIDLHVDRRARSRRGAGCVAWIAVGTRRRHVRRGHRVRRPAAAGGALPTPWSSSLSGSSGLGSPFFSTARYRPKVSS